ncbi:MAG: hypothetical protein V4613_10395 [Bacteroidota bacterium]
MGILLQDEENIYLNEERKIKLIKTIYCVLLLYRTYQILNAYFFYQSGLMLEEWIFSSIYLGVVLLTLFSRFWIAPLLIALLQSKIDSYFSCNTVGSVITVFMNFYFAAYYFTSNKFKSSDVKDYSRFNTDINHYKFLLVMLWSIINLYSLDGHLKDSYWMNGQAFGVILCNPFLSPHYAAFRHLSLSYPQLYNTFSEITSYSFIVLQALMIPLFLIKKTRVIFYLFLLSYIIGITFFIDTSFLAHFACLLFYLLLPQFRIKNKRIDIQKNPIKMSRLMPKLNLAYALFIAAYVLINTPYLNNLTKKTIWLFREWDTYKYVDSKLKMVGLVKVNLFNKYQIEGGDKWFVIYKQVQNDWQLVPLMDTNGRKLSYNTDWLHTCNHGSDFLWLANTFNYAIGEEHVNYSNSMTPYKLPGPVYERLIRYDFNKYAQSPAVNYKVSFYSNTKARKNVNPFIATKDSSSIYQCTSGNLNRIE